MSNSIGDLKNSGLQGNNWPWQYKVLLGLDKIAAAIGGKEYEAQIVKATCPGPTPTSGYYLEVRVYNTTTGAFSAPVYYLPGSTTTVNLSSCTLEYANDSSVLTQIYNELVDQGLTLDAIETAVEGTLTVQATDLDIRQLDCGDKVSVCFNDGVNDITVSTANPLPVDAAITFPSALAVSQDPISNPWTVDGTVGVSGISDGTNSLEINTDGSINVNATIDCSTSSIAICDGAGNDLAIESNGSVNTNLYAEDAGTGTPAPLTYTGTGTANALDVNLINTAIDIRPLDCTTDSIAICDGTGGPNLAINNPGGPSDGSINTVLVDLTTGTPAVINSDGTQNNQIYAYDTTTVQTEALTTTAIGTAQALDVNIINTSVPVTTGSASSAPVGMYGSTDGGTNWTAVQVDSFGAISTNSVITGPTGVQPSCDDAISTALCQTQEDILTDIQTSVAPITTITPNILLETNSVSSIGVACYSASFANIGSTDVQVSFDGGATLVVIPAGVTINMDAGGLNNKYPASTFAFDTQNPVIGTLLVTYNS